MSDNKPEGLKATIAYETLKIEFAKLEAWNAAIEAVAKHLDEIIECELAEDVRKMKK